MFGTGIKRIMDAYKDCKVKPRFEIKDNSITVTLPTLSATMSFTSDEKNLLELLNSEMRYSSSEIAEMLKWSKDKAVRKLNELVNLGYVAKYGTGRSTKYSKK
jgi:ATP-dependent DNA helicase RecG